MLHGFHISKFVFFVNTSFYVLKASNSHIPKYQEPKLSRVRRTPN